MPGERQTPTVRLRRLAAELRLLRTSSGLTRDEIAERSGINVATLYRIEHARVRPQTRTLRTLLALYGVEGAHQDELIACSHSSANGQCVEVAPVVGAVVVRDSKHPAGPELVFTRQAWVAFVEGVKAAGRPDERQSWRGRVLDGLAARAARLARAARSGKQGS